MNIRNRKANKPFRLLALALVTLMLGVLVSCHLPAAHAEVAYGSRIVSPPPDEKDIHKEYVYDTSVGPALADLQSSLEKMTGRKYTSVVGDDQYKGDGIFLVLTSSPKAPADAVAKLKDKGYEPFIVRSKDSKNLWIIANSEAGLAYGVYFYLDKLGCRWFLPNDNWTIIPKSTDVVLKIDRLVAPAFKLRNFNGTGGYGPPFAIDPKYDKYNRLQFRIQEENWQLRNGFGGEYVLGGHAGEDFNLVNKAILEAHPEYCAPVNGKRAWSEEGFIDPTNADAVKLWVDYFVKLYREARKTSPDSPYSWAVSVDPADGAGLCDTPECRAKFQAHGENDKTFFSNEVFYLANQVAKAVRKEFPDGHVSLYAYAGRSAPPSIPLEPNVAVALIPYGFNYSGLAPDDFIAAWSKKTSLLSIYDYWSIPDWTWDQPTFNFLKTPKEKIGYWYAHNTRGFQSESTYSAGAMGLAWYLSSRLMWNPNTDYDWFLADFYKKSFGAAAPPMKRMMERWTTSFLLTSQEMAQSFRDLQEAEKLADGDTAIQARIDDFAKYVQYLRLYKEYIYASDPKLRQEADKKLIVHIFDIYDTNMVGSFRIYQFLVNYGNNKEMTDEFNNANPDAPGWKLIKPYTHEEVASLISDGVNDYPLLNYTPITYSGKLMPLTPVQPLTVPDGDKKWGTRMATRGGMDLQIDVPEGLDTLPFRVDSYYDKTIALVDANGKELWKAKNTGIKEYETPKEFEIPIPAAGRYTIQLRTAGGLWFQTLKGLTLVFPGFLAEMGSPSPRVYFYVPSGVRTIAMYLPGGNHQGYYPQVVKDPDGKQVTTESHDAGTLVIVTVPEGQDGKVWSLEAVRTPDEPIRMLNVPNFFSLSPDSLMVPQDALK